jgi:DNA-binding NtrC family response regulator
MNEEQAKSNPDSGSRIASGTGSLVVARAYLDSGAVRDAETVARRILSEGTCSNPEALLILAQCLLLQGRIREVDEIRPTLLTPTNPRLLAELQILDAQLMIHRGDFSQCLRAFDEISRAPACMIEHVKLSSLVAQCFARLDNLQMARQTLDRTVEDAERLGWSEGIADGLTSLALLDRTEGHWSRADGLLLQARETYRTLGLSRKYIKATLNLGLQRLWCGHLTFAEEALREAVRLSIQTGDAAIEATARADRGLALVRLGRTAEARVELSKSLRLCRRQASPRRTAIALEYTGELHLACGNNARATGALRRALAIANRIAPDGDIVPEVLRRQAEVALAVAAPDDALRIATDAAERAERYGDRYERATALRVQGQALYALEREVEGEKLLRFALTILEELGETFERDRILAILGELDTEPADPAFAEPLPTDPQNPRPADSERPLYHSEIRRIARRHGLFGSSRKLMDVMREAYQVASLDIPILIQGETGTGKELLAQAIHQMGRWSKGPLVAFNCATCPSDLLDAELFGHKRGAYTGATSNRTGLVRSAEGGTLFLDEIGELREESQARLLRFLDSGEVRSLGSDETVRVKVRILAATHVNLEKRVDARRFRRDLYFRLTGLRLVIPPLRERRSDIRLLIARFTDEARDTIRPGFAGLGEAALRAMEQAWWPGNVRQLKAEVMRLAALTPSGKLVNDWSQPSLGRSPEHHVSPQDAALVLSDPVRLSKMLMSYEGRVADVATALGVSRGHVYKILKLHGLRPSGAHLDD